MAAGRQSVECGVHRSAPRPRGLPGAATALLGLCAKLLKKRGLGSSGGQGPTRIEVLARQGLGRTSSVQLVRVAGRTLVLGVTETSVSVLGEADPLVLEVEQALALPSPDAPRQSPPSRQLPVAPASGQAQRPDRVNIIADPEPDDESVDDEAEPGTEAPGPTGEPERRRRRRGRRGGRRNRGPERGGAGDGGSQGGPQGGGGGGDQGGP